MMCDEEPGKTIPSCEEDVFLELTGDKIVDKYVTQHNAYVITKGAVQSMENDSDARPRVYSAEVVLK